MLFLDFHDDAIVGLVSRFGLLPVVLYNREVIIQRLVIQWEPITEEDKALPEAEQKRQAYDQAQEFFESKIAGVWAGNGTPAFTEVV